METNGGGVFRHRRTPSSDRFLKVFSQSPPDLSSGDGSLSAGDELDEDEIFLTGDIAEPKRRSDTTPSSSSSSAFTAHEDDRRHHRLLFPSADKFGVLAALPEDDQSENLRDRPVVCRTSPFSSSSSSLSSRSSSSSQSLSISSSFSSSSRMIPLIPKPPTSSYERSISSEFSRSLSSSRKFHQSAPMNVPVLSKAMESTKGRKKCSVLVEVDDGEDEDDEMLPPHEIVARASNRSSSSSPKTTCSVLEGVGRTLKGRDLRQVRNAVWHRTGFLD